MESYWLPAAAERATTSIRCAGFGSVQVWKSVAPLPESRRGRGIGAGRADRDRQRAAEAERPPHELLPRPRLGAVGALAGVGVEARVVLVAGLGLDAQAFGERGRFVLGAVVERRDVV